MGRQFLIGTRTMKFLVVLALVAAAYAEPEAEANADPAYYYSGWYGHNYNGDHHSPYYRYASPYWGGYYNRGYGYWKRDADSQPEAAADPAYYYAHSYHGYAPAVYHTATVYNHNLAYNTGYAYAAPYNYGYYNRVWKRDAEAEPEADAEAYWYGNAYNRWGNRWGYSGWYNRPYGYNWGYSGYYGRRYGGYWW